MTFAEQPQIEFPEALSQMGFEDRSYRNDCAAFTVLPLEGERVIALWITEEKTEDREYPDAERFAAWEADETDDMKDPQIYLYQGESLDECIAAMKPVIDRYRKEVR